MVNIIKDGIILALQFLTTVPIKQSVPWDEKRLQASVAAYPLIGLIIGSFLAILSYVVIEWTSISPLVITALLLTLSLVYSGGLHLDGWADFHDAIFSRRPKEQKLEIMKDPRVGTFGVLAVLFLLFWRYIFMYEIIASDFFIKELVVALLLIPFLSRLMMGWQLLLAPFAKKEGMAKALEPAKVPLMSKVYIIWTLVAFLLILLLSPPFLFLLVGGLIFFFIWYKWVTFHLGGITGDTLGALAEGGETFLWGVVWLLLLFVTA